MSGSCLALDHCLQARPLLLLLLLTFRCSAHRRFLRRYLLQPSPRTVVHPTACTNRQKSAGSVCLTDKQVAAPGSDFGIHLERVGQLSLAVHFLK
jgi:hypothetical protein